MWVRFVVFIEFIVFVESVDWRFYNQSIVYSSSLIES
jgi:hypothetical protein